MIWRITCRWSTLAPLMLMAFVSGCGSNRSQVSGRVTYKDGSPVDAGIVIGESTVNGVPVGVQGNIEKDGYFTWGADRAGDGALPGKYRVAIMPVALGDAEMAEGKQPAVDSRYTRYETSGITYEVTQGKNTFNIQVTRPKPKLRKK